ncbi:hypothetical protein IQ06DRAFT_54406 [Phaeosphaeriaceae sp. SRC1lsM3a]|nr:hypothetical protein IQ06DRAFT_54406 [Stagonospora sp. SRC1lsM3a]
MFVLPSTHSQLLMTKLFLVRRLPVTVSLHSTLLAWQSSLFDAAFPACVIIQSWYSDAATLIFEGAGCATQNHFGLSVPTSIPTCSFE